MESGFQRLPKPFSVQMSDRLHIEVVSGKFLSDAARGDIVSLCNRAYEDDLGALFDTFVDATHVLGLYAGSLTSHAMWVTRWLQPGSGPPCTCRPSPFGRRTKGTGQVRLRTAYVEMVATEPEHRRRGFATEVMKRLAEAIADFELGALCPAEPELYARLGWVFWRGPLFIRTPGEPLSTPDESVMILRLSNTPPLDLDAPLSAEWRPGELW
jgi:aminoglycoside 2'-N-acetyltransferase I